MHITVVQYEWHPIHHLVCIMIFLQDYGSESSIRDSGKIFSSAHFLLREFGSSSLSTTQFSSLAPIMGEFGGLTQL